MGEYKQFSRTLCRRLPLGHITKSNSTHVPIQGRNKFVPRLLKSESAFSFAEYKLKVRHETMIFNTHRRMGPEAAIVQNLE